MTRKMKILKQSLRDIEGLGGHKSISFNDLCKFPIVHLPIVLKTPKKYDGHGYTLAHLKRYPNQLRVSETKKNCSWLISEKV